MKKQKIWRRAVLVASLSCLMAACGGGGDGSTATAGASADTTGGAVGATATGSGAVNSSPSVANPAAIGTLRLALTDAPACGFDKVFVTVERVRVHQSSTAADGEGGWSEVVLDPAKRVDLLALTNGVLSELGQTALPAGKYTQLRLVLAANGSTAPFANSALPTGSKDEVALTTPSADQSGLKLNTDMDVTGSQTADFVIDFDACKSIVSAGGSGKYLLKPVLTVSRRSS
jgi:hypothetical protein